MRIGDVGHFDRGGLTNGLGDEGSNPCWLEVGGRGFCRRVMPCPRFFGRGEEMAGVVASFSLEVGMFIPFTGSFYCRTPFVVTSFTFGALVEDSAGLGSADDGPLTDVFYLKLRVRLGLR